MGWAFLLLAAMLTGCGQDAIQVYRVAKEPSPPQSQATPDTLPPGHPDISGAASSSPSLKWQLPAGWQKGPPSEMRAGSFQVKGANGKQADVSVIPLPGLAGGDLNNVNRWRGQVGLGPVPEEELSKLAQPVQIAGQPAQLFEQAGTNPASGAKERILAAILRRDGVAWFFKMTGDDELVAQQKAAFIEFLKTVKYEP